MTLPTDCYQRAVAYFTDPAGRLLVFDHVDVPEAGTQVPAGGIHPGEPPADAALRELAEESGLSDGVEVVRELGQCWWLSPPGRVPEGREEQVHHAFHLRLAGPAGDETWEWDECGDGDVPLHRFRFRWVTLEEAASVLHPVGAAWIPSLRASLGLPR